MGHYGMHGIKERLVMRQRLQGDAVLLVLSRIDALQSPGRVDEDGAPRLVVNCDPIIIVIRLVLLLAVS